MKSNEGRSPVAVKIKRDSARNKGEDTDGARQPEKFRSSNFEIVLATFDAGQIIERTFEKSSRIGERGEKKGRKNRRHPKWGL